MLKKERKQTRFVKVRHEGGSTVLTVGKLIPLDWKMVELEELRRVFADERTLKIVKVA